MVREGFSGGTRAAFLSYSKSFVNSFLCYNSFVCYANVANSFMCYINLKYIWANYVLLKPSGYTPTLKKNQVVRDLKKFENHWPRPRVISFFHWGPHFSVIKNYTFIHKTQHVSTFLICHKSMILILKVSLFYHEDGNILHVSDAACSCSRFWYNIILTIFILIHFAL